MAAIVTVAVQAAHAMAVEDTHTQAEHNQLLGLQHTPHRHA